MARGCAIAGAIVVIVPLIVVGVVGVRTWAPLREAGKSLAELEQLGLMASYTPAASGEISPERMELFLDLRARLTAACRTYGNAGRTARFRRGRCP